MPNTIQSPADLKSPAFAPPLQARLSETGLLHTEAPATGYGPASFLVQYTKATVLIHADLAAALFAAASSFYLSNTIRDLMTIDPVDLDSTGFALHVWIVGLFTAALFMWFGSKGHYRRREALVNHLASISAGCAIAMLGDAAIQFATVEVGSRLLTLSYWFILAPALVIGRLIARNFLRSMNLWASPAVLFTPADRTAEISGIIRKHDELGVRIMKRTPTTNRSTDDILHMMRAAARSGSVVIYAPSPEDRTWQQLASTLVMEGVPFILSPQIGAIPNHAEVHNYPLEDISFLDIRNALARPIARAVKRLFDLIVSAVLLVVASPLLVPITLAIRLDGGPALFRQKRVGLNGDIFDCLKFRSMVMNAEDRLQQMIEADPAIAEEWKAYQKLRKDPRITWIGSFIRKANLDELPQLINILRGDMSLVGPRPMTIPQIEEYGAPISAYQRMRPGITGIWQTNGRNQTTFAERARLDAWYVRNWSLWRDVVILIRTVREVIFARGG